MAVVLDRGHPHVVGSTPTAQEKSSVSREGHEKGVSVYMFSRVRKRTLIVHGESARQ